MPLNWNEIKSRAIEFSNEWDGVFSEDADAKPFLVAFFNVFGLNQRKVATFEHKVKKLDNGDGYIDLLWKGQILIEMKSKGKDLTKAYGQAKGYLHGLSQIEIPKYVLVCDFERFRLYDLEEKGDTEYHEFLLKDLVSNVEHFGFIAGYQKKIYREEDPVNIKAAELMGKLHDRLKEIGYEGHPLEVYLVRVLFCLFAEDTTIFEKQQFQDYIEQRTSEDGSDLAAKLQELFQVLNTPIEKRFKNLDEQLLAFPYVNGKLFEEILPTAFFDAKMRQSLLECCYLDWSKISPAIFGSMFQSVMDTKERRNLGAHYTSEKNILKLIKPLFLDDLRAEFERIKNNSHQLRDFHFRLSKLRFLDPACGCGNFLVITYRELRLLELDVLRALHTDKQVAIDLSSVAMLDVDMMHGIEIEEFPARIAEVAMWLIDHQMNMLMSMEFGQYYARLPLKKSAHIVHGNALRLDWNDVVSNSDLNYIIGNPPFYGSRNQNAEQKLDTEIVFGKSINSGVFDYVACWYFKSAKYIKNTKIKVGFVSTNSICQGVQIPSLWKLLIEVEKLIIHFAHQTFSWSNEAKGNAAVHCVIIGFANYNTLNKTIYEYEDIKGEAHVIKAKNINPYLVDADNIFIEASSKPISERQPMMKGNAAIDDGNFLFSTEEEANYFKTIFPEQAYLVREFIGSDELINNYKRFCLWLKEAKPADIKSNYILKHRVDNVKAFRLKSPKAQTRKYAETPTLFMEDRQPNSDYLMIPVVSSENRKYIPIGFLNKKVIANYSSFILPNATVFEFGIISSLMHNVWIKNICGRLKSDIRYSNTLGYNNFPFPEDLSDKYIRTIETAAQKVLDTRKEFPNSSLADLYDPLTMPPSLVKAHQELDKAVDLAYRPQPFPSEAKRMEFLFELYEKYTANLFTKEKVKPPKKRTGKPKE